MICLDTNYLIMGLVENSDEQSKLLAWVKSGETFCVSSIVWYEFLCGPVSKRQVDAVRLLISDIVDFDETHAETSSRLFNAIGRTRKLRIDAMIAATAIKMNAPLATSNIQDFSRFAEFDLQII